MSLKIRYCPDCAQPVHFEADAPVQRCWNCGCVSDFDLVVAPEVRFMRHVGRRIEGAVRFALEPLLPIGGALRWMWPSPVRFVNGARWVLVGALPIVVTMLLVASSLFSTASTNFVAPFSMP